MAIDPSSMPLKSQEKTATEDCAVMLSRKLADLEAESDKALLLQTAEGAALRHKLEGQIAEVECLIAVLKTRGQPRWMGWPFRIAILVCFALVAVGLLLLIGGR
jgi:hypothetical protein